MKYLLFLVLAIEASARSVTFVNNRDYDFYYRIYYYDAEWKTITYPVPAFSVTKFPIPDDSGGYDLQRRDTGDFVVGYTGLPWDGDILVDDYQTGIEVGLDTPGNALEIFMMGVGLSLTTGLFVFFIWLARSTGRHIPIS